MSSEHGPSWVSLEEVAAVQGGIQKQAKRRPVNSKYPFLRVANVLRGKLLLDDIHEVELFPGEIERYRLEPGDLLVVEGNGSPDEIGRAALWGGTIPDCVHQNHLIRVRPKASVLPSYLELAWNSPHVARQVRLAASSTSGLHTLSTRKLKNVRIPLFAPDEQRRIVEILEDQLSRLDAANDYLDAAFRRTQSLRAAWISRLAVTTDPLATLGSLAVHSGYGTSTKCLADGPGLAVVRIPNLREGAINLEDEKRAADDSVDLSGLMLQAGDLLVVRTNGSRDLIGRTAVVQPGIEAAFASYLIRYRLDQNRVLPEWVHLMLDRSRARRVLEGLAASSAGQYNLGLKKLDAVEVPVPTLDEQHRRIGDYWAVSRQIEPVAEMTRVSRRRNGVLRRALLAAAFSGRLTGHSSDLELAEEMVLA